MARTALDEFARLVENIGRIQTRQDCRYSTRCIRCFVERSISPCTVLSLMRLPSHRLHRNSGARKPVVLPFEQQCRTVPRCKAQKRQAAAPRPVASTAVPVEKREDTRKTDDHAKTNGSKATPLLRVDGARDFEVDTVLEKELHDNGFRSTRRTKIICTIGPCTSSPEMLQILAEQGMNVARLNMGHGTREWHKSVIDRIRKLNHDNGFSVAIMMDTEGSEIHTQELEQPIKADEGSEILFTIRSAQAAQASQRGSTTAIGVSYDAFVDDIMVGDLIVLDGGMVSMEVVEKAGPDVRCNVVDPGIILSRANLTFRRGGKILRGRNAMLPVLSSKDWLDIDFAISEQIDFIAISFVKGPDVINNLKSYLVSRAGGSIEVIAKVESYDSVPNVPEIVAASDAVMVARGDLGAQIPLEDVPSVQKEIVMRCRQQGKPVIVASHLLQSMIEYPTPTRAEVADIADVVRQRADALMLSGESAAGAYPEKAVGVLRAVATRIEEWCRQDKYGQIVLEALTAVPDGRTGEELCASAASMANNLGARAIFVYTRRGYMASFLSRCRPDCPIFAFTDKQDVRQRLNLRWGVIPFRMDFAQDPEENIQRTFQLLKRREMVTSQDLVIVVSDLKPKDGSIVRSIQVRRVPQDS